LSQKGRGGKEGKRKRKEKATWQFILQSIQKTMESSWALKNGLQDRCTRGGKKEKKREGGGVPSPFPNALNHRTHIFTTVILAGNFAKRGGRGEEGKRL